MMLSVVIRVSLFNILAGFIIGNDATALRAVGLFAIRPKLGDFLRRYALLTTMLLLHAGGTYECRRGFVDPRVVVRVAADLAIQG